MIIDEKKIMLVVRINKNHQKFVTLVIYRCKLLFSPKWKGTEKKIQGNKRRKRKNEEIIICIFTSIWKLKGRKGIKIKIITTHYFILANYKLIINFEGIIVISQKINKFQGHIKVILWIWREI